MKKLIPALLLAFASGAPLLAQSADPDGRDDDKTGPRLMEDRMQDRFWERLDLSDDQKQKLKQIREADCDNLRTIRAQVKIARESLKAALLANPENTADVQVKAVAVANALSSSSVQMALHLAKISQVLTPAQRVEAEEAREHWMMHRWRQHDGGRGRGAEGRGRRSRQQDQEPQQTPEAPKDSQTPADSQKSP
jgi:Spy/CpxP family protein refolding chaperone